MATGRTPRERRLKADMTGRESGVRSTEITGRPPRERAAGAGKPGQGPASLDDMDRRIIAELAADSSVSVPKMSKRVGVSANAVYARIEKLRRAGIIRRYSIVVDGKHLGYGVKAMLGVNMDIKLRPGIVEALMGIPEVAEVAEVTGRFDMLVTIYARSLEDMHRVVYGRIGRIRGILSSESFLQMKSHDKAMPYMPSGEGAAP